MLVHNLNDTSDNSCRCGTWIRHWENYRNKHAVNCVACHKHTTTIGAHVQKTYSNDQRSFIVPLCYSCNKNTDDFDVPDDALIPAMNLKCIFPEDIKI